MKHVFALFVIGAMFLVGCGTTGKFVYPAKMSNLVQVSTTPMLNKTVAVIPFDDYRDNRNSCCYPIGYIPLMPFGWATYNRPDAAREFTTLSKYEVTPSEDLAKAAAVSLRYSRIFEDAFFTMGGEKKNADYVLSGKLKTMRYKGKQFTYCLSICGSLFWFLGAPAGTSENQIALELQLKNRQGTVVWEWTMAKEYWIAQWIYARIGHDGRMFATLYQEGMNEAVKALAKRIQENPESFK